MIYRFKRKFMTETNIHLSDYTNLLSTKDAISLVEW
jgi:hypothetical protein